jgi:hypothetical protein
VISNVTAVASAAESASAVSMTSRRPVGRHERQRVFDDPAIDVDHHAEALGRRQEAAGRHELAVAIEHPHEDLLADRRARRDVDDRLREQHHALLVDRVADPPDPCHLLLLLAAVEVRIAQLAEEPAPLAFDALERLDLLHELVVEHAQLGPVELGRRVRARGGRLGAEDPGRQAEQVCGLVGLDQHVRDAARVGQRARLVECVGGGAEDDGDRRPRRELSEALHELIAVDPRHEDVGEDERGPAGGDEREALLRVGGLEHLVAGVGQDGRDQVAVRLAVVDDEHDGHQTVSTGARFVGR